MEKSVQIRDWIEGVREVGNPYIQPHFFLWQARPISVVAWLVNVVCRCDNSTEHMSISIEIGC